MSTMMPKKYRMFLSIKNKRKEKVECQYPLN